MKKILLVDDENDIRLVASLSLRRIGHFDVSTAESGAEGLLKIKTDAPDVVLLDMMMPGMDGLLVLEKIKADPDIKDIPVIFMTARVQAAEKELYLSKGAAGVISKPFDPMSLPMEIMKITDIL